MDNALKSDTIRYYEEHAGEFFEGTVNADMSIWQQRFLKWLPEGSSILDAGCGSGRDSRYFMERGYQVSAVDASPALCTLAKQLTGLPVRCLRFEELDYIETFNGIWACASLLHVGQKTLPDVMERLNRALKSGGILYASFKYGEGEKRRGERSFTDMTEETARTLLESAGFEVLECELSVDVRPDRENEQWTNIIGRKKFMKRSDLCCSRDFTNRSRIMS